MAETRLVQFKLPKNVKHKEAKKLIASGILGNIRKVYAEYPQGWLSTFLEKENNAQAAWRTDPTKSGAAGAMGDIGTHVFNLAEYVSGLKVPLCSKIAIPISDKPPCHKFFKGIWKAFSHLFSGGVSIGF